jgi:type II restriction enzyme
MKNTKNILTSGQGWFSAKNKLKEAYNIIPSLYNLTTLENFIKKIQEESIIEF